MWALVFPSLDLLREVEVLEGKREGGGGEEEGGAEGCRGFGGC